jgi:lipoprotein-releasing system permease protein
VRYELRIGLRYLYGGKTGRAVFSVFTNISVLGVALGVAALTIVLAVTTGFQKEFRDKVLGVNAHVIVTRADLDMPEYRNVLAEAKAIDPDVIAAEPFIFAEMLATRGKGELSGVAIKGVDPQHVGEVLDLAKAMKQGSLDSLKTSGPIPPLIIGVSLAQKLKAKLGDTVTLVSPLANLDPETGRMKGGPHTHPFRITGIFYSGFDEYDRRLTYASLADTQSLLGLNDIARGVELKIKDVDRASDIARKLDVKLGGMYEVQDWFEMNHNLFQALALQKVALVVILTLIVIVAAVNMVSALTMMVTDKTREIAILKSMGSSNASIARVFRTVGLVIGGVGTVIGVAFGLGICAILGNFGFGLDPHVYLIDHLPVEVKPLEVLIVVAITMVISVIATVFPARTAAALTPIEGLRYD